MKIRSAIILYLIVLFFISINSVCFGAQGAKKNVKEGNILYQKGKLDEALQKYNEASISMPDSDIINFNMGAALYKKEDYQKAADAFTKALTSQDRKIEADALYNLGNSKYKLGKLKENTDLSSAVSLMRESLDYYKRAVESDQNNKDARFNHEFVERELKVLLDKLKQQQSEKQKQQSQQEQKQEQQQGQGASSEKKEQGEAEPSAQGQQKEQSGEQKQEKGESAQAKEEKQEGKEQQERPAVAGEQMQQEDEKKELSKEEARMLLDRYGQEKGTPDYMDRRTRGYDTEVTKDW